MFGQRTIFGKIMLTLAVLLVLVFSLFPFAQILSTSLKHQYDWANPSLIPQKINWKSYQELLGFAEQKTADIPESIKTILNNPAIPQETRDRIMKKYASSEDVFPFIRYMANTFVLSLIAASISMSIAVFGAYSISRIRFKGRQPIQRSVLFVYMIGGVLLMVPLYQMSVAIGLATTTFGSLLSLVLIYIVQTLPLALYMLGNYFRSIPYSLEEAAMVDGFSRFQSIFKIVIPLSMPMLATVFIYCFIIAWNEFLFASVFLKQYSNYHTLPLALQTLFVSKNAIWGRIMAASMLTLLPVTIAFMFAMKRVSSGMTEGGVKE